MTIKYNGFVVFYCGIFPNSNMENTCKISSMDVKSYMLSGLTPRVKTLICSTFDSTKAKTVPEAKEFPN